jgi:hypothetical protein
MSLCIRTVIGRQIGQLACLTHKSVNALRNIEYTSSMREVDQAEVRPGTYGPRTAESLFPKPKTPPTIQAGMAALIAGTQRDISKVQLEQGSEEEKKKSLEGHISFLRLPVAGVAGAALIGLMLLMMLHLGRNTDLITTSVAVSFRRSVLGSQRWILRMCFLGRRLMLLC